MLKITTLLNGPIEENCHVMHLEGRNEAVVVDPGSSPAELRAFIDKAGLKPVLILATHGHFDHVGAVHALAEAYAAPFACLPGDERQLEALEDTYAMYGMGKTKQPKIDRLLRPDEMIQAAGFELKVLHTPGHTPGGACFYHAESGSLFTGDTLFRRSIGRSDFEGGDGALLVASIRSKLFSLPEATRIYPGHGDASTIGEEKRENPFVR